MKANPIRIEVFNKIEESQTFVFWTLFPSACFYWGMSFLVFEKAHFCQDSQYIVYWAPRSALVDFLKNRKGNLSITLCRDYLQVTLFYTIIWALITIMTQNKSVNACSQKKIWKVEWRKLEADVASIIQRVYLCPFKHEFSLRNFLT